MRLDSGFRRPKDRSVGVDMAGRVVAVGSQVTRFKVGDEVFGTAPGAFAEYALASDARIALKPAELTFEQAASIPVAATTALQGLRDKGGIEPGDHVLINGASGGVGTFAVQIAKAMGAHVTAVCSGRNAGLVRSLGADEVIDYTRDDFTTGAARYDIVLDLVGNRSPFEVRHVLEPGGANVLIGAGGPQDGRWIGPFGKIVQGLVLSVFVDQKFEMLMASVNTADLGQLAELVKSHEVVPVIDRRYTSLSAVPEAITYLERGRARGKVIVTPAES
jgi:NADPH:quinone reductase-like Zn-dependent oxidoreductase